MRPDNPLIVQSDRSLLLHTVRAVVDEQGEPIRDDNGVPQTEEHPRFAAARDALATFAELEKSPDYLHSYRLTPISIWNAAALGLCAEDVQKLLEDYACVPVPASVLQEVRGWFERYGLLAIERKDERFRLTSREPGVLREILGFESIRELLQVEGTEDEPVCHLDELTRGTLKQALIRIGYPVDDRGGYAEGDPLEIQLAETEGGFQLRSYQREAAQAFHQGGTVRGGSGVVVLPCGAGKTVVALAAMELVGTKTLILTTNTVAVRQWREEILAKTELTEAEVGEYTGEAKLVRPVTISTYQMLTWRRSKSGEFEHFELFRQVNWGLVVYDEVHLLPAPIFRVTAELQARRRLGLTATLVREDGKEDEVFCLIGPKRFELPWKVLETQGFIATARCVEVRVPLEEATQRAYDLAGARAKFRVASENPAKMAVVRSIVEAHPEGRILVIGQFLDQLEKLSGELGAPLITGKTPNPDRERLYSAFREGSQRILVVSKVGNFAIDLPDANVAIQISGTFGSRQEEAQRLGRILRPKSDGAAAVFFAVTSLGTRDQEFAQKRQLFLTEQGYAFEIVEVGRDGPTSDLVKNLAGDGAKAPLRS